MNGVIIMDKPQDYTSFDVVAVMRRLLGEKKIGHTGTLDPMATGVLPLLLGKATRAIPFLEDSDKRYEACFQLGYATDTQDSTGRRIQESARRVETRQVEEAMQAFRGEILQLPPMYSAVQKNGQRLYELARRGIEVEREKRPVTIYRLELLAFEEDSQSGRLLVDCSKGTYIRTLCHDLGVALGTCGVMTALRRTTAAGFTLEEAVTLEEAKEQHAGGTLESCVRPVEFLFREKPEVVVSAAQAQRFCNGGALALERLSRMEKAADGKRYRVKAPDGRFLGLCEVCNESGELKVARIFCD